MTAGAAPVGRGAFGRAARRSLALALRLAGTGALLAVLGTAAASPEMPVWLKLLSVVVLAASAWRPDAALPFVIGLAPFGEWSAGVPVRATEAVLYAFFAGWLLRLREPLDPDRRVSRLVLAPALALAAVVVASWSVIVAERSVGLSAWPLAVEVIRTLPADYLVTAGRDPQVAAAFQLLLAIAVCLSVPALAARDRRLPRRVALSVAIAGLAAGAIAVIDVPVRYVKSNFDLNELSRYFSVTRSRLSLHMTDNNAAGSHYALAGLVALAFACKRSRRRWIWIAGLVLLVPALWIDGSRAAMAGGSVALVLAIAMWRRWFRQGSARAGSQRAIAAAGVVLLIAVGVSGAWLARRGMTESNETTAAWSMGLRAQFFLTSARMVASAPMFGVGVGKYYERSAEFMPEQIRSIYGRENAHDYFAQMFAELGVLGGLLFLWFVGAVLLTLWRGAASEGTYGIRGGLLAACVGFLLTCLTGHPLLVVEAALPFWAAMGAGLAAAPGAAGQVRTQMPVAIAAVSALIIAITLPLRAADRLGDERADFTFQGLHDEHQEDGLIYRWTSEHAVVFVGREPGLVVLPVRSKEVPGIDTPFEVTVAVSGTVDQRVAVPADRWLPVTVVLRGEAPSRMRRIDLRVNQTWSAKRNYGDPADARPMGVMLGPIDYRPRPTAETRSAR